MKMAHAFAAMYFDLTPTVFMSSSDAERNPARVHASIYRRGRQTISARVTPILHAQVFLMLACV